MNTILLNTISDGKVVIKRGEGGGNSGGGNTIEYLDISGMYGAGEFGVLASLVKVKQGDGTYIIAPPMQALLTDSCVDVNKMLYVTAIAIDPTAKTVSTIGEMTLDELVGGMFTQFPRLTEEEFYNLNA